MGSAVASAAVAQRYSRDRKIRQSERGCEEYFLRGKGCSFLEMVSKYNTGIFLKSVSRIDLYGLLKTACGNSGNFIANGGEIVI
jgi:hypothetical protein